MAMNAQQLFDAITAVNETYIIEAEEHRTARRLSLRRRVGRRLSIAAAVLLALCCGVALLPDTLRPGGNAGNGGNTTSEAYMAYAGPIFPLDTLEALADLTAVRTVTLDLSSYADRIETDADGAERTRYDRLLAVTDAATLTNTGDAPLTFTAVYPFMGTLSSLDPQPPEITLNGQPTAAALHAGAALLTPENTVPNSWQSLAPLVSDGSYRDSALRRSDRALLEQPVTVYEFRVDALAPTADASNPILNVTFGMDPQKTSIVTWGSNAGTVIAEPGVAARQFDLSAVNANGDPAYGWLIVLGEDIESPELACYSAGAAVPGEELPEVDIDAVRYASTLGGMLSRSLHALPENGAELFGAAAQLLEEEALLALTAQTLDTGAQAMWPGAVEDAFAQLRGAQRILYLTFPVTLPAGESVTVTACFDKEPSFDHYGSDADRNGYELVTRTHALHYTAQYALLQNTGSVEILAQDLGYDPGNAEPIPLTREHYTLVVRKKTG